MNASQIHNTTGVFNMGNWHKDTQEILLKDIFDIDAEFVRWNPIFTELSQYLHKLKKWDGDLHHEMSYANESKNDIYFRRSQIHEQVKVSCQRLIACTKEVLEHKMKMVFDMAKHVETEQIVKFWNLLKFCLKYRLYFEDKIPDTTKTVLFEAQAHIDECILNASATFPSRTVNSKTNFILLKNSINANTEIKIYLKTSPELEKFMRQKWNANHKQFIAQHDQNPDQIRKLCNIDINRYLKYVAITGLRFAQFCDKQYRDIALKIKKHDTSIMQELVMQPNFSWHSASDDDRVKIINDLREEHTHDILADVRLVHEKCINYAYSYLINEELSTEEYNNIVDTINSCSKTFLMNCQEAYEREAHKNSYRT